MLGYMEQTVAQAVTKAMTRCGCFKPKYPFLTATQSALIYIAYHLKGKSLNHFFTLCFILIPCYSLSLESGWFCSKCSHASPYHMYVGIAVDFSTAALIFFVFSMTDFHFQYYYLMLSTLYEE